MLHRLFDFLVKLGKTDIDGNTLPQLASFWTSIIFPPGNMQRSRGQRVRDYRLVAVFLQQCACIFQGALDTHELDELPLPQHLVTEGQVESERARKWGQEQGIKGVRNEGNIAAIK